MSEETLPSLRRCPGCNADLTVMYGTVEGSRAISVNIRGAYDGGLYYQCPDCAHKWHRWPVGSRLRDRARPYVNNLVTPPGVAPVWAAYPSSPSPEGSSGELSSLEPSPDSESYSPLRASSDTDPYPA